MMIKLVLFISGAVVMALEILGAKIIHPFFGVTLYVWAAMIAVTLLSLAVGYWLGGKLADRFPEAKWLYGIVGVAGFLMMGIPWLAPWLMRAVADWDIRLGILSVSLVLFALPLSGLGMVSPYCIRLSLRDLSKSGAAAGMLYAISTAGSLAGTLLTAFWLVPVMAVSKIFMIASALLVFTACAGYWRSGSRRLGFWGVLLYLILMGTVLAVVYPKHASADESGILYQTNGLYGQIKVVESQNLRALLINGAPQNYFIQGMDPYDFFSQYHYGSYFASFLIARPQARKVLIIGLGAGQIPVFFSRYGIESDIIEIDPRIKPVAEKYFGFTAPKGDIYWGDGRRWIRELARRGKTYDAVFVDAFASYDLPDHFFTAEMFRDVRSILPPGGVLAVNTGGILRGPAARIPGSIFKTLRNVFAQVRAFDVGDQGAINNIVFFASDRNMDWSGSACRLESCETERKLTHFMAAKEVTEYLSTGEILSDDYNPLSFWSVPVYQAYRRKVLDFFGQKVMSRV